jgi:hypothetical protein
LIDADLVNQSINLHQTGLTVAEPACIETFDDVERQELTHPCPESLCRLSARLVLNVSYAKE